MKQRQTLEAIFRNSWEIYKKNLGPLIIVTVLGMVAVTVMVFIAVLIVLITTLARGGQNVSMDALLVILPIWVIISIVISILYSIALIKSVALAEASEKIDLAEVLKFSLKNFWPVLWVGVIAGLLILMGFVFAIIPGIILAIYFQFVLYALIFEKKQGFEALVRSFEIVKGHWWWTLLIVIIISLVPSILSYIPVIGSIAAFLLIPFWQVMLYLVYKDLRKINQA